MALPTFPLPPDVLSALASGNKVEAIRLLREATGLGLKEAKDAVEGHRQAPAGSAAPQPGASFTTLPADVVEALQRGRKIEAVRLLRRHTGLGMKDAKDAVDRAGIEASMKAGTLSPGEVPRSSFGSWLVAAIAIAAAAAYYFLRGAG